MQLPDIRKKLEPILERLGLVYTDEKPDGYYLGVPVSYRP